MLEMASRSMRTLVTIETVRLSPCLHVSMLWPFVPVRKGGQDLLKSQVLSPFSDRPLVRDRALDDVGVGLQRSAYHQVQGELRFITAPRICTHLPAQCF